MDDEVVVFASFDESAVFADEVTGFALQAELRRSFDLLTAAFHGELNKCISGPGGRRWAEHLNSGVWQRRIDVAPHLVRILNQCAVDRHFFREGQEELTFGQRHRIGRLGVGEHDPVETNLHFRNGDAVLRAGFELGRLDAPRCIGDVGVLKTYAGAKQLEPAAGPSALDHRGLEVRAAAEILGDRRREREHG